MIRLYAALGVFATFGAVVAWAYWHGISVERTNTRLKNAEGYQNERKAIDEADVGQGNPDDDRDWLSGAHERLSAPR
ncbi:MAG: hypothetical protein ACPGSI_15065 [Pikeienuella sp.]